MAETFYSVLGVEADADAETIRRAYREQVKRHHPDVSDDPDAPERFKRLTTARNVLVDDGERSRYDRLGHDDYVRQHAASTVWAAGSTTPDAAGRSGAAAGRAEPGAEAGARRSGPNGAGGRDHSRAAGSNEQGYDRTTWLGEDGSSGAGRGGRRRGRRGRARAAGTGSGRGTGAQDWQRASRTYRRADTDAGIEEPSLARSVAAGLVSVGPWLVVHAVFVASAAATAYLAFVQADSHLGLSWPTILAGVLFLGFVVFASVLHVVSQLYS